MGKVARKDWDAEIVPRLAARGAFFFLKLDQNLVLLSLSHGTDDGRSTSLTSSRPRSHATGMASLSRDFDTAFSLLWASDNPDEFCVATAYTV